MPVAPLSAYVFAMKASNSFGHSPFTKEQIFVAADLPVALRQVVVSYVGANVSFSWNNSFDNNGFDFTSFDLSFSLSMHYYSVSVRDNE